MGLPLLEAAATYPICRPTEIHSNVYVLLCEQLRIATDLQSSDIPMYMRFYWKNEIIN